MTRSPIRAVGRPWQGTILALLVLSGASLPAQDPSPPQGAVSPPPVTTAALRPAPGEHALVYASALARARRGDLGGALAELEALRARTIPEELAAHVARDVERLRCFEELRTKHLAELAATGGKLRLELEGRDLSFIVEAVEEDRIVFRNSLFGVHDLPLSELDSLQVAKQIPRDLEATRCRWVRLYPYVLCEEERGFQLLRRDCKDLEEAAPLLADAEHWYPGFLPLIEAALLLQDLSQSVDANGEGASTLERVGQLVTRHGELAPVRRRLPELRALAAACLQDSFRIEDLLASLSGRAERLRDGSWRLAYDFEAAEELDDFKQTPGYPPERIAALPALKVHAAKARFELDEGELVVAGSTTWRHVLPLPSPITVRCRLRVEAPPKGGSPACFWMIGACDDGRESYVALQELGTALSIDKASGFVSHAAAPPSRSLSTEASYELELACDGETVRTRVDGELVKEIPAGVVRRGEVFFLVHSDAPVHIDRIEVEVAPGGLGQNPAWLAARLGELGFPAAAEPTAEPEGAVQ